MYCFVLRRPLGALALHGDVCRALPPDLGADNHRANDCLADCRADRGPNGPPEFGALVTADVDSVSNPHVVAVPGVDRASGDNAADNRAELDASDIRAESNPEPVTSKQSSDGRTSLVFPDRAAIGPAIAGPVVNLAHTGRPDLPAYCGAANSVACRSDARAFCVRGTQRPYRQCGTVAVH